MSVKSACFRGVSCVLVVGAALTASGCSKKTEPEATPKSTGPAWQLLASELPSALLSVSARSAKDVFVVGADKGDGPVVFHFDGAKWSNLHTGQHGDLWWVQALPNGPALFGGAGGMVLRYDGTTFERLPTPGLAKQTVFGVWGTSAEDFYAVGNAGGRSGFVWHWQNHAFTTERLPDDLAKTTSGDVPGLYKVFGLGDEVWIVGGNGVLLHRKGNAPFTTAPSGTKDTIFTVHGSGDHFLAVGGSGNGLVLETKDGAFHDASPPAAGLLQGIFSTATHGEWASGERGAIYTRAGVGAPFVPVDHGLQLPAQSSLHSITVDDAGGVWSAGGNVLTSALDDGMLVHFGPAVPEVILADEDEGDAGSADSGTDVSCPANVIAAGKNGSIARRWNEQALAAVRLDPSRPTVSARTLFHLSTAMWDAWAAYDSKASGVFAHEKAKADDVAGARAKAISYAAYDVLAHRFADARTAACLKAVMTDVGLDPNDLHDQGDDAVAVGHRIGHAVLSANMEDGAHEANDYADPSPPVLANVAFSADGTGASPKDPAAWAPLSLPEVPTPNGGPRSHTQVFLTSQWGAVRPFALKRASTDSAFFADVGPQPHPHDPATNKAIAEMLTAGATLDAAAADTAREPPMVTWNVVANEVADAPGFARKAFGRGDALDALAWDVRAYLALNGALHDAAVASWDALRRRPDARPISLVRFMGGKGQSSDPKGPAYDPDGLPLVPDVVAVVTKENSVPGAPLANLSPFVGQVAIRAWRGELGDPAHPTQNVDWVRAVEWVPHAPRAFVSPPWPATVSASSAFATAAITVLEALGATPPRPLAPSALDAPMRAGFELRSSEIAGQRVGRAAGLATNALVAKYFAGTAVPKP